MTNKHTPGPWRTEVTEDGDVRVFEASNGDVICSRVLGKEMENARLIAAAPELLAALETLLKNIGYLTTVTYVAGMNEARVAIAKATGGAA